MIRPLRPWELQKSSVSLVFRPLPPPPLLVVGPLVGNFFCGFPKPNKFFCDFVSGWLKDKHVHRKASPLKMLRIRLKFGSEFDLVELKPLLSLNIYRLKLSKIVEIFEIFLLCSTDIEQNVKFLPILDKFRVRIPNDGITYMLLYAQDGLSIFENGRVYW